MDIDPRRLPFLLSVAREGGIVAAADILMVSPSAVSQQIQKLEEEVGLKLVERTTSGAILTPAGTIVAEAGERIKSNIAEALKALRPLTGQVTGTVTLGAFLTICRSTLIPALPDLTDALPRGPHGRRHIPAGLPQVGPWLLRPSARVPVRAGRDDAPRAPD